MESECAMTLYLIVHLTGAGTSGVFSAFKGCENIIGLYKDSTIIERNLPAWWCML